MLVKIVNNSPAFLRIGGITIPDNSGGIVDVNGQAVTSAGQIAGFGGQVTATGQTAVPTIVINNTYDSSDPANQSAAWSHFLTPDVEISGKISNLGGAVLITSVGNVSVNNDIDATKLSIQTQGNFVLDAPRSDFHIGGDPAGQNSNWGILQAEAENLGIGFGNNISVDLYTYSGSNPYGFFPNYLESILFALSSVSASNIIAANNVTVIAQELDVNGTIQSGIADYNVQIGASQSAQVAAANTAYEQAAGGNTTAAQQTINSYNSQNNVSIIPNSNFTDFQLDIGAASTATDPVTGLSYATSNASQNIPVSYNAVNGQLEVNAVKVQGGYMSLVGRILSTSLGNINVLDGYGRITINNQTSLPMVVNRLDTGAGVEGFLEITDTGKTEDGTPTGAPLVTDYRRLNGNVVQTQHWFVRPGSGSFNPATSIFDNTITVTATSDLGHYNLYDRVIYSSGDGAPVGGLVDGDAYYIAGVYSNGNTVALSQYPGGSPITLSPATGATATNTLIPLINTTTAYAVNFNTRSASYNPASTGYRYVWTTGQDLTISQVTTYGKSSWLGIDALAADPSDQVGPSVVTTSTPRPLPTGSFVEYDPSDTADFSYSFQRISATSHFDPQAAVSGGKITLPNNGHVWHVDDGFTYNNNGGNTIGGLSNGNTYYVTGVTTHSDGSYTISVATARRGSSDYQGDIYVTPIGNSGQTDTLTATPNSEVISTDKHSHWYGVTTYYWTIRSWVDAKDINTFSIRADRQIGINFIGHDAGDYNGGIKITSNGDVIINGTFHNALANTSIVTQGSITSQSSGDVIGGQNISFVSSGTIGAPLPASRQLNGATDGAITINIAPGGTLTALTTQKDISIDQVSGNLNIYSVVAGGDLALEAAGSILPAAGTPGTVYAGSITLTADTGSVGTLGTGGTAKNPGPGAAPLQIGVGQQSSNSLYVTALSDVNVEQGSGNLNVFKITGAGSVEGTNLATTTNVPAGNVRVTVDSGDLVDVNTFQQADDRTTAELSNVYANMLATITTAQASINEQTTALVNETDKQYQQYWQLRDSESSDLVGGLTEGTTYYVVPGPNNTIELATSFADATAASPTVLSLVPSTVHDSRTTHEFLINGQFHTFNSQTGVASNAITLNGPTLQPGQAIEYFRAVAFDPTFVPPTTAATNAFWTQYYAMQGRLQLGLSGTESDTFGPTALVNGNEISLPGNTLATGQPIAYEAGSGSSTSGLIGGTTYYAVVDPNNSSLIGLSTTPRGAATGALIPLGTISGTNNVLIEPLAQYIAAKLAAGINTAANEFQVLNGIYGKITSYYDPGYHYQPNQTPIAREPLSIAGRLTYWMSVPAGTFSPGQAIVFHDNGNTVLGVGDGATYYAIVSPTDPSQVALDATYADAVSASPNAIAVFQPIGGANDPYLTATPIVGQSFGPANVANSQINLPQNVFVTGEAVVYHSGGGSVAGLVDGATYYVVLNAGNSSYLGLADTAADAFAGMMLPLGAVSGNGNYLSEIDAIAKNVAWSTAQLQTSINAAILGSKATNSTVATIKDPSIIGNNVDLITTRGTIGSIGTPITLSLPLDPNLLADDPAAALALARRSDRKLHSSTKMAMRLQIP